MYRPVHIALRESATPTAGNPAPWASAELTFLLTPLSFDTQVAYPESSTTVTTDTDGEAVVNLWANEEGSVASQYLCRFPSGEVKRFTLPPGDGSQIELALLLEAGVSPMDAQFPSLLSMVQEQAIEPAQAATAAATAAAASATTAGGTASSAATSASSAAATASAATSAATAAAAAANTAAGTANTAAGDADDAAAAAEAATAAAIAATNAITGGILVVDSETGDSLTLHAISPATITSSSHTLNGYVIDTAIIGV